MKRTLFILVFGLAIVSLTSCLPSSSGDQSTLPTPNFVYPTATPTVTPSPTLTANPSGVPTAAGSVLSGSPAGPYAVIRVDPGDVLNIRSAPGQDGSIIGSLAATATNVIRTGPSSNVGEDLWVQVQNPVGGTGWASAFYLTEYVPPATFCADSRVNTLLSSFANAVRTSNGGTLASLVSPLHGMAVRLWRNGSVIIFDQAHTQWIFLSTYEHNWGAAPGSGLDTNGAIHDVVLPKWLDVLNASYMISCNAIQTGGATYTPAWPVTYTNINFYSLHKPGPAGNELSWRTLLIGVEYVQGQPYIFSVTQMDWEP